VTVRLNDKTAIKL